MFVALAVRQKKTNPTKKCKVSVNCKGLPFAKNQPQSIHSRIPGPIFETEGPFMGMFLKTRGRKIPGASFTATNVRLTNTEKRKLKTPKGPANQLSAPLTRDDSTPVLGFLRICVLVFVRLRLYSHIICMYIIY